MASEPCCSHEVGKRMSVTRKREMVGMNQSGEKLRRSKRARALNCNPFCGRVATDQNCNLCAYLTAKKKLPEILGSQGGRGLLFFPGAIGRSDCSDAINCFSKRSTASMPNARFAVRRVQALQMRTPPRGSRLFSSYQFLFLETILCRRCVTVEAGE